MRNLKLIRRLFNIVIFLLLSSSLPANSTYEMILSGVKNNTYSHGLLKPFMCNFLMNNRFLDWDYTNYSVAKLIDLLKMEHTSLTDLEPRYLLRLYKLSHMLQIKPEKLHEQVQHIVLKSQEHLTLQTTRKNLINSLTPLDALFAISIATEFNLDLKSILDAQEIFSHEDAYSRLLSTLQVELGMKKYKENYFIRTIENLKRKVSLQFPQLSHARNINIVEHGLEDKIEFLHNSNDTSHRLKLNKTEILGIALASELSGNTISQSLTEFQNWHENIPLENLFKFKTKDEVHLFTVAILLPSVFLDIILVENFKNQLEEKATAENKSITHDLKEFYYFMSFLWNLKKPK